MLQDKESVAHPSPSKHFQGDTERMSRKLQRQGEQFPGKAGEMAWLVKYFLHKPESLGSDPQRHGRKPGMAAYV